jgi:hypothetical protein
MATHRLKNLVILTLALANLFLLCSLGLRQAQRAAAQSRAAEELTALYAAEGVTLHAEAISFAPAPAPLSLARDNYAEKNAAESFLGENLTQSDEGGGIRVYSSPVGQAVFRASGLFEITGDLGENAALLASRFCRSYGCQLPDAWFGDMGSGSVTVNQIRQGYAVEDCTVTFYAQNHRLVGVSGTFLPVNYSAAQNTRLLSASTALTAFLDARRTSGAVVSGVSHMVPCYQLQSSAATLSLSPMWRLETDTVDYYVNCITGSVTRG